MDKNINSILEGLYGKSSTQYGYVHTDEGINEEDRWITIKGAHILVDDNGTIKNKKLRDKIESTSKKKVVKKKESTKKSVKSKVKAEPYTGKRSGDKELDDKFDKVRDAQAEWDMARKEEDRAYKKVCKSLGIKNTRKESIHSYENQMKVKAAKDPNLIKAKKAVEKAVGNHAKLTREFRESYRKYKNGGGEPIRDYYQAAVAWDDHD